jgi:hypothetical protein
MSKTSSQTYEDHELEIIDKLARFNHLSRAQMIKHGFFKYANRELNRPNMRHFLENESEDTYTG